MPSSLVFAALVLAWLAVLVPIVAHRRQMVPRPAEADLSARVLPRAAGAPANEELPVTSPVSDRGARTGSRAAGTAVVDRDERTTALDAELDSELDLDTHDADDSNDRDDRVVPRYPEDARDVDDEDAYDDHDLDAYDVDADDDQYDDDQYDDDRYDDDRYDDEYEDVPAARTYRPGRGGFDAEAAAEAAQHRYAFRQRVALGLIAVAVLSALAALVVSSTLWWLHLVADVALVGYLVFLRRQTRLEEDLRARRAARWSGERRAVEARRERQAEHEARMAAVRREEAAWLEQREDGYDDHDDDGYDDEPARPPRWAAPRTPAPAVPDGMELVADSADDPDFHPLDGRESVPSYRRAAGA